MICHKTKLNAVINFQFRKQEKSHRTRSGEYGECYTFTILCFTKTFNSKPFVLCLKTVCMSHPVHCGGVG